MLIHDPDEHAEQALDGAFPALAELRAAGVIGAVGVGMNQAPLLEWFVRRADLDCVLVAGRYSLLDGSAAATLLPRVPAARGGRAGRDGRVQQRAAGPARPGRDLGLRARHPAALLDRARRIAAVCARHGLAIGAVALQFVLAHPAVTAAVLGVRSAAEMTQDAGYLATRVPDGRLGRPGSAKGLLPRDRLGRARMILDAHHHLWDPGTRRHAWLDALPPLRRPFGIREFSQLAAAHGVTASVLVQVLARPGGDRGVPGRGRPHGPLVAGVVGWADLTAPGRRLTSWPGCASCPAGTGWPASGTWSRTSRTRTGWTGRTCAAGCARWATRGWSYDLLVRPAQLPAAVARGQRPRRGAASSWTTGQAGHRARPGRALAHPGRRAGRRAQRRPASCPGW